VNQKPDVARERRTALTDPNEIVVPASDKAGQAGHTHTGLHGDQVLADVVQFASHRAIAGNAQQPPLLRHVGELLIEGDELPPFRRGQMSIGSVRVETEGHRPHLPCHASRFLRADKPHGNIGFATTERYLLPLGRKRKPDVRIPGPKARQMPDEKMGNQNGRRTERHPTDKRRMGGLCQARDAVSPSFHFLGSRQHLTADCCEAAGSRQAIDKPNVKCGLERGKPPADRRVVHSQIASGTGKCADLCHGQEMPDVFPIDHLREISRIARIYTEFSHRGIGRISG